MLLILLIHWEAHNVQCTASAEVFDSLFPLCLFEHTKAWEKHVQI